MRVSPSKLSALDPSALTEFGHLLETFVGSELLKQVSWLEEKVITGHWRTRDGDEVDFVIEFDDGRVLASRSWRMSVCPEPISGAFAKSENHLATA